MFKVFSVLLVVLILTACVRVTPVVTPEVTWPTKIELVENDDDVQNVYSVAHGPRSFMDISLEQGTAVAQLLCKVPQDITVGAASMLNAFEVTLEVCPELLENGVLAQVVNTQTTYSFDCRNCDVFFSGDWEYGKGVSTWRGTIWITPHEDGTPSLFLVPLNQPR